MIEFLSQSKNFNGVTFSGCFNMDLNHLEAIYKHYQQTGENLLDDYCTVKYALWDGEPEPLLPYSTSCDMYEPDKYSEVMSSISKVRRLRIFESEKIRQIQIWTKQKYQNYIDWRANKRSQKRIEACSFIAKTEIRGAVFELHGEECLKCGTDEGITLDHVVPVSRDGENCIENLQPLCKSCNSSKGTQIIDYRE